LGVEAETAKRFSRAFASLDVTRSEQHRIAKFGKPASDGKADAAIGAGDENCPFHGTEAPYAFTSVLVCVIWLFMLSFQLERHRDIARADRGRKLTSLV
jgi:hypothetical protein